MKVLVLKGLKAHAVDTGAGIIVSKELMKELKSIPPEYCPPEYASIMLSGVKVKENAYLPIEVNVKDIEPREQKHENKANTPNAQRLTSEW